jgi:predicted TIM-barrel fold metal-dependent hydrolase
MSAKMLEHVLPALHDEEGAGIPRGCDRVIDAHVHLFPTPLFAAIWDWFDEYGWPVRYRLTSDEIIDFLMERGVARVVGLHYAHKPGIARSLNRYMADLVKRYRAVWGTATVFPGEPDAAEVLARGFDLGLVAVKLHAHVQGFAMDSPGMREVYEMCACHGKPLIMHVGREPKSPRFTYPVDPYRICSSAQLERVVREYPELRVCVPHLGADEFIEYSRLLTLYDNLWLDTAMTLADYLPIKGDIPLESFRMDRIMYGTDFPNIPYAWDREIRKLCARALPDSTLKGVLSGAAEQFFSLG